MRKFLFRRGVLRSWLISHCIILCLSLSGMIILLITGNSVIRERLIQLNRMALSELQTSLDSVFVEIRDTSLQIAFSHNLDILAYKENFDTSADHYNLYTFQRELQQTFLSDENCETIFLFFERSGYIVTPDSVYDPAISSYMLETYTGILPSEWHDLITSPIHNRFFIFDNNGKKEIIFRLSVPLTNSNEKSAVLFAIPNRRKLESILRSHNFSDQGALLIVDDAGHIIFSQSLFEPELFPNSAEPKVTDNEIVEINGQRFVFTSIHSSVIPCHYMILEPYEEVFGPLDRFVFTAGLILGIVVILGGLTSYWVTMHNYSPLRELLDRISDKLQLPLERNEYNLIDRVVQTAIDTRQAYRRNELIRFLRYNQEEQCPEWLKSHYYMVFLIRADQREMKEHEKPPEHFDLINLMLCRVLEELLKNHEEYQITEIDRMIAVILCSNEYPEEEVRFKTAQKLQNVLENESEAVLSVSYSTVHSGEDGLACCYQEAYQAMEYRIVVGSGNVIPYHEAQENEAHYDFSLETEQNLIYAIQSGNFENATQILNDIYNQNFKPENLSVSLSRCLMFDLLGTIIKALDAVNISFISGIHPVDQLLHCETLPEMKRYIDKLLREICQYVETQKNKSSQILADTIIGYMKQYFSDPDLNISAIADHFGCSPAYLSKVIKKAVGKTPLEYITILRINQAKELLENSDYNLEKIAAMTGYISSNTFIRTFKRYTGITPGTYRDINTKENNP